MASNQTMPVEKLETQLSTKFYFALLSCLGGLVLSSSDAQQIPVIAVFAAAFGFLFVDWLRIFALPPILAYVAMGAAAIYCVGDFWQVTEPGNRQMISVAQLLVLVQMVLMLQEKSVRIYEQLSVFSLLQLVVAAVYNDTLNYGFLLVAIGIIAALALGALSSLVANEGVRSVWQGADDPSGKPNVQVSAEQSAASLKRHRFGLSRFSLFGAVPAAVVVGGVFFYALPRRTDASRLEGPGKVLTGFSDQMKLDQIGKMLQNPEPAVRVKMTDRRTDQPYRLAGGLYLRGKVLESYTPDLYSRDRPTAIWSSVLAQNRYVSTQMPREPLLQRVSDKNFFDSVQVEISCESLQSPSVFSIAPYYRSGTDSRFRHTIGAWTLTHADRTKATYKKTNYQFLTHAFHDKLQTDLIAVPDVHTGRSSLGEMLRPTPSQVLNLPLTVIGESYRDSLLYFEPDLMPTVAKMARLTINGVPEDKRQNKYEIALALQRFLALNNSFEYTMNLNAKLASGVDPIEQFIATHRKGHCQYFAAALALMLRSVGIPSRVVVGYHTDEYNDIGQYFLARQSHAHAWVEALIPRSDLEPERYVYGQPQSQEYWLRLDPTPGGGGGTESSSIGMRSLDHALDMAKNLFGDHVIYRDQSQQSAKESGIGESAGGSFAVWIKEKMTGLQSQGESKTSVVTNQSRWLLWICVAVIITAIVIFLRLGSTKNWLSFWRSKRFGRNQNSGSGKPQILFYADALVELGKFGILRRDSQTPAEFSRVVRQRLGGKGDGEVAGVFEELTDLFCQLRYGSPNANHQGSNLTQELKSKATALRKSLTAAELKLIKTAMQNDVDTVEQF